MRAAILEVPAHRAELADEARAEFGFAPDRTTVVVFGGSQGALHIDETIAAALPALAARDDLQLLVLCGADHVRAVEKAAAVPMALRVQVMPFLDRMELAYALADLAVTRAGATSIAEMTVCGDPDDPDPVSVRHGEPSDGERAGDGARAGPADLEPDPGLSADRLAARILALVDDPERRARMGAASAAWAKPDADTRLAALVVQAVR